MTLYEDCMDESDAERDLPCIDYGNAKKFTSKLPKIGTSIRGRRVRDLDTGPSSSGSNHYRQLSPLSVVVNDHLGEAEGTSSYRARLDSASAGPESRQQFFRSPEIILPESGNGSFSPRQDSQDSICSSDMRRKKKPHFQRMLEKAREEDQKGPKPEKPLYQRMLEKAQANSDVDERAKDDFKNDSKNDSKNSAAQKRIKLPKLPKLEKTSPSKFEKSSPQTFRGSEKSQEKSQQFCILDHDRDLQSPTAIVVGGLKPIDLHRRIPSIKSPATPSLSVANYSPSAESIEAQQRRRVAKKPLFQRLMERAQADADRALREKMDQYNMRRIMKKKSNAPSREEIKERIDQGIARNDSCTVNIRKEQEDRERERDRDRETVRIRKRQRALGVHSLPKGSVMGPYSSISPLKPQNQNSIKSTARKGKPDKIKLKLSLGPDDDDDDGYRVDDGDVDSVSKKSKSRSKYRVKGRARTLEKIPNSMKRIAEDDIFVSESESKRMAEMMSELHDEHHHTFDSALPIVSYDSPSSLNVSGEVSPRDPFAIDDIDALFSPLSDNVSNDSDSFIRKMKEVSGDLHGNGRSKGSKVKPTKGRWSPRLRREDLDVSFEANPEMSYGVSEDGEAEAGRSGRRNGKNDTGDVKERERKRNEGLRSSQVRFKSYSGSRDVNRTDLHRSASSNHSSGLVGLQWVAEVLESDENEQGLVMMYSEGFSMFMAEEGLILDSLGRGPGSRSGCGRT